MTKIKWSCIIMAYSFITFGCWNNRNYKTIEQPMDSVLEKVTEEITKGGINRIIVSGDNYYPEKKKENNVKIKNVYIAKIKEGIQKLNDAASNTPISMVMGNHDLDSNGPIKHPQFEINPADYVKKGNCSILQEEIANQGNIDYQLFGEIDTEISDVALLMIDTTIYAEIVDDNNYLLCYKEWFEKQGTEEQNISVKMIQDLQLDFVREKIQNKTKIILIGHHPIYYKKKNGIIDNNISSLLIKKLNIQEEQTIYYICADRHYYQYATFEINSNKIHQYIVGTGGAELDDLPNVSTDIDGSVTFSVVEKDQMKDYGFLKVSLQEGQGPTFKFNKVDIPDASSSGGKKSRKRRNSKLRKKQSKKQYRY